MSDQFVYFLRPVGADGPVKIGCSFQPQRRLETMMAWSPVALEIVAVADGDFADEAKLHRAFVDSFHHGEWFCYSPELGDVMRRIAGGESLAAILTEMPDTGKSAGRGKLAWTVGRRTYQSTLSKAYAARKRGEKVLGCRLWWPPVIRQIADAVLAENRVLTEPEGALLSNIFANPTAHFLTHEQAFGVAA